MIKVKHIPNILSKKGRSEWDREYSFDGLVDYIPERYNEGYRVIHSRHGIVCKADWATTVIRDGDEIIITPEVKIAAGIGALLIKLGTAAAVAEAIGTGIATAVWLAVAGASIFMSMKARNYNSARDSNSWEESPTYGWDGARTMADTELPVPIIYGKVRVGGNIISSYLEAVDDLHYLNIIIGLGEGPVQSIGGIESSSDNVDISTIGDKVTINGNPIANYQDVDVFVRMGEDVQTIIPGFDQIQEEFDLSASNIQLMKDVPYTYTTTNYDVDSAVVSLNLPNGLHKYKEQASGYKSWYAFYEVAYRLHTDVAWTVVEQTFPRGPGDGQDQRAYRQYTEGGYGAQPPATSWPTTMPVGDGAIYGKTTSTLRRQFTIEFPGPGRYDIRLTRTSQNSSSGEPQAGGNQLVADLYVQAINERRAIGLTYPYTAMLGLRVLATEQLAGSFPTVITEVEGLKVTDWNGGPTYSNNPMSVLWDLLTNDRYGAGLYIEADNMDAVLAQENADYCDEQVFVNGISGPQENRFEMDIAIDGYRRALDILVDLCASFRAFPFYSDGAVKIIIDKPETPVQTFGMGNIIKGSFGEDFASIKRRKNRVQIQFLDGDKEYQRDTVEETDEDSLDAGDPVRDSTMFMPSIIRQSQALRIARYMLKLNVLSTRTVNFTAGIDGVTSQVGDVINVAHNLPQWGLASGRVKSGTASTVTFKDNVTIPVVATGVVVVVQIRHADNSIEEQDITSAPGEYKAGNAISIAPATFDTTPDHYDVFVVGIDTLVTKPFRIMKTTRNTDYNTNISAVEYDEDIYDESSLLPPADQFSFLPDPRRVPLPVENLVAEQNFSFTPHVVISFEIPEVDNEFGFWDHGEVQLGTFDEDDLEDGPTFEEIGTSQSEPYLIYNLTTGRHYRVRVVSVSKWGIRGILIDAATVDFIVGDSSVYGLPPTVKGLEIATQGNDQEFRSADLNVEWRPARSFETAHNPAGAEPLGAGQGQEDSWFRDYKVVITTRNAVRRTIFTKDSKFTYTRQMNYEDNREFHETDYNQSPVAKVIEIQVWVRDVFNQLSARSARLLVNNPRPAPIGGWALSVRPPQSPSDIFTQVDDLGGGDYRLSWQQSQESDVAGYKVYRKLDGDVPMDDADGQPVDETNFLLDSDSLIITGLLADVHKHHFVIAPYDDFDRELLNFRRNIIVSYDVGPGVAVTEEVIWAQSDEPDIPKY